MFMKKLTLNDISDLAEYMLDKVDNGLNVTSTLFYDDASALTRELMLYDNVQIGYLEITSSEYNNYDKEYYVTLSEDKVLSVEPAWKNDVYLYAEPDLMIIDGDASHKIIEKMPVGACRELCLGVEEDCVDEGCNECCCDCSDCAKSSCCDTLDQLMDGAKIIYDSDKKVIGFSVNAERLFKYLFS